MISDDPQTLLKELCVTSPKQIDIEAIAQYCGATVIYENLVGCEARIIGCDKRAIITVSQNASVARRRFSVAHELGHWLKHRGKVALVCSNEQLVYKWDGHNKEGVANRYAAEVLLPQYLFQPFLNDLPISFETVKLLAQQFETSLTATAMRAVQLTHYPAVLICSNTSGRKWFELSPRAKEANCWPRRNLPPKSWASALIKRDEEPAGPRQIPASVWFGGKDVFIGEVTEDTMRITAELVLSLVVWNHQKPS